MLLRWIVSWGQSEHFRPESVWLTLLGLEIEESAVVVTLGVNRCRQSPASSKQAVRERWRGYRQARVERGDRGRPRRSCAYARSASTNTPPCVALTAGVVPRR